MYIKNKILFIHNMICGILLLSVSLSAFGNGNFSNVYAQAWTSTHTITYFLGNKLGAISFNFDDGYPSHLTAAVPQLNARGLKGTFFIITGRTDVSTLAPWSAWQSIAAQGHEVASHTVTHKDLTTLSISDIEWQLSTSQSAINQNIPGQSCNSLDYPFTSSNSTIQTIAAQYYDAARGGWISGNHPPFLNYYQSGSDQSDSWNALNFYNLAGKEGDALGVNDAYLTDPAFNESLDKAVLRHAWLNIFFHDITDATAFGKVLDYTQTKHDYWIDTFCNVSRYMKERLNSTIQIITDTPTEIRINILMDASLPTTTYNFPLTLRSTVPTSWAQVVLQQGSVIQTLTPVMEGSDKVVYYNAVPNGGDISLTATNTSTSTPTLTPTAPTQTAIKTPTKTPTAISTATNVPTIITPTPTYTPTYTATNTPTNTPTSTLTFTETNTPNVIPTDTPTYTATNTPTDTSISPTNTPTATWTNTPTNLPTNTTTPTNTLPPPTPTNTPFPGPANTGFLNPSANAAQTGGDGNGYQTNSTNAYTNNSMFAVDTNSGTNSSSSCTDSGKDKHRFYNYGFSIPGTTVLGIEVKLDAKADSTSGAPKLCIQLSWNAGTSWTTAKQTGTLTTTEKTYMLGSPSDNWGHTWTLSQLSNANFRVRVIDVATNTLRDFSLDWITVRVTYK